VNFPMAYTVFDHFLPARIMLLVRLTSQYSFHQA
jgi:hypothetical protein